MAAFIIHVSEVNERYNLVQVTGHIRLWQRYDMRYRLQRPCFYFDSNIAHL